MKSNINVFTKKLNQCGKSVFLSTLYLIFFLSGESLYAQPSGNVVFYDGFNTPGAMLNTGADFPYDNCSDCANSCAYGSYSFNCANIPSGANGTSAFAFYLTGDWPGLGNCGLPLSPGVKYYDKTASVCPNTDYTLYVYFWSYNCAGGDQAIQRIEINGTTIASGIDAPGTWQLYTFNWNSGPSTTANIKMYNDGSGGYSGNDWGLDEVYLYSACPSVSNNTVSANQSLCTGNTATNLSGTVPTLSICVPFTYQWQSSSSISGPFSDISGANGQNYSPGSLITSTSYRRVIKINGCVDALSNIITITVNTPPVVSAPTVTQPTCSVSTGTIVINATGATEYSVNNGTTWQTSNTFSGLAVGSYTLKARNAVGCETTYSSNPVVLSAASCVEICSNGIDDDGDGLIDCQDNNCPCASPAIGVCYRDPSPVGAGNFDAGIGLVREPNGNFIEVTRNGVGVNGWIDFVITRLTPDMNTVLLSQKFVDFLPTHLYRVNKDSSYIVTGALMTGGIQRSAVMKLDKNFNQIWKKEYTIATHDANVNAKSAVFIGNAMYMVSHQDFLSGAPNANYYMNVLKINLTTGALIASKSIQTDDAGNPRPRGTQDGIVRSVATGDLYIPGSVQLPTAPHNYYGTITRLDTSLNVIWDKQYTTSANPAVSPSYTFGSMQQDDAGNLMVNGWAYNVNTATYQNIYFLKVNPTTGNTIFSKTYNTTPNAPYAGYSQYKTLNNEFVIVGNNLAIRINALGNVVWAKLFPFSVSPTTGNTGFLALANGNLIFEGAVNLTSGGTAALRAVVDSDGNCGCNNSATYVPTDIPVTVTNLSYFQYSPPIQTPIITQTTASISNTCGCCPDANFGSSIACATRTVTFTDSSSIPAFGTLTRLWKFGDGTTSSATAPTKVYAANGTYIVTLILTMNSCIDSIQKTIIVSSCPELCSNSLDDDGDGLADCQDPDCALASNCAACPFPGTNAQTAWEYVTPEAGFNRALRIKYTGFDQSFTVPTGVTSMKVKAWGAGGGEENWWGIWPGGSGGYSSGIATVTPSATFKIVVGGGGNSNTFAAGTSYGFGGATNNNNGRGGGLSGIFTGSTSVLQSDAARAIIIAGGGGGGSWANTYSIIGEPGGLVTSGGMSDMLGGPGNAFDAGGGGGGYLGGIPGNGNPSTTKGGRNYVTGLSSAISLGGNGITPPNTGDIHYITRAGFGDSTGTIASGAGTGILNGGNGLIVIQWNDPVSCCTPPVVSAPAVTQPTCSVSTGTIVVNATGATEYSVNNGTTWQASNTFSGLAVGSYTIKARNAVGCETAYSSNPVTLTAATGCCTPPVVSAPTVTQPTCALATGTIVVNATGATEYSVNNGTTWQASATFSGLAVGSYTLKARNAVGCETAYSSNPVTLNTICNGANVKWANYSGMPAGSTSWTGTGFGNSTVPTTISGASIESGDPRQFNYNSFSPSSGSGLMSCGQVWSNLYTYVAGPQAAFAGGTAYTITMNLTGTGSTVFMIGNVGKDYTGATVHIQLKNGATNLPYNSVQIDVQDMLAEAYDGVAFYDNTTGNLTNTSGTSDSKYIFFKVNTSFTQIVFTYSRGAGGTGTADAILYAVGETGACSETCGNNIDDDFDGLIDEGCCTPPVVSAPTITQPTCALATGTIVVNATGATEYSVNNGTTWQASNTFSGLAVGSYTIKARNAVGCETAYSSNPVTLTAASGCCTPPVVSAPTVTQPTCALATGTIVVNATGATEYSVNNGTTWQASNTFSGLAVGSYTLKARNAVGCETAYASNPVTLNASPPCLGAITQPTCPTPTNGVITLNNYAPNSSHNVYYKKDGVLVGPVAVTANSSGVISIINLGPGNYTDIYVQ